MVLDLFLFFKVFFEQLAGIRCVDVIFCICSAVVMTICYAFICNKQKKIRSTRFLIFVFWALLFFEITFLITIFRREPGTEYHSGEIVPYIFTGNIYGDVYDRRQTIYNFLNIVLFVPIGFFLRGLRTDSRGIKDACITVLLGFLFSFFIECVQLITKRGNFELNDIVTNTLGAFLGIIIFELLRGVLKSERIK